MVKLTATKTLREGHEIDIYLADTQYAEIGKIEKALFDYPDGLLPLLGEEFNKATGRTAPREYKLMDSMWALNVSDLTGGGVHSIKVSILPTGLNDARVTLTTNHDSVDVSGTLNSISLRVQEAIQNLK